MEVNFNNLRLQIQKDFNELSQYLEQGYCFDDWRFYLDAEETDRRVTALRNQIATLMCLYLDEETDISDKCSLHTFDIDY